ncbi:MAG: hypothetical protein ACXADC_02645 [Candidatus Thorarchaeota archaeon]|jgi:hypothetical protein
MIIVESKTKIRSLLLALGVLVLLLAVTMPKADATVVWTENFNEIVATEWTVQKGSFSVLDNTMRVSEGELLESMNRSVAYAYRNSSILVGTWCFDVFVVPSEIVTISFMRDCFGLQIESNCVEGYSLVFDKIGVKLLKHSLVNSITLAVYVDIEEDSRWYHVIVTRDADGCLLVYLDGVQRLKSCDLAVEEARYFSLLVTVDPNQDTHSAIDNIIVTDSVPSQSPATTTTTTGAGLESDASIEMTPILPRFELIMLCAALPAVIMAAFGWSKARQKLS